MRFSSYLGRDKEVDNKQFDEEKSKCEIIEKFLRNAKKALQPLNTKISVDVFGCIIEGAVSSKAEANAVVLGQNYINIASIVDYVCPMIYPSHFGVNSMEIKKPDLEPYNVIYKVLKLSEKMLKDAGKPELQQKVRPYLQAFTAKWLKNGYQVYSKEQIEEQIKATTDAGLNQWSLFNGAGSYKNFE